MKEFWCRKIVTFMHDPFEKTHILVTKHEGGHEGAAKNHLRDILKVINCEDKLEKLFEEAKDYDVLSATLDRWVMVSKVSEPKHFINPFDPDVVYCVGSYALDEARLGEFYDVLKNAIEELKSSIKNDEELAKAIYHVLYGIAESLWYKMVGMVQVADTRSPTHTIFDHLSASVGVSNIYDAKAKKFEGYVVEVDFPGIQSFISGGRGPGDWWIRSWLISAFMWYLIKELVWELGADIMLSPTARYNPFYYSLLREKLFDKSSTLRGILDKLPYPDQPVMPGTVTLLLPKLDVLRRMEAISKLYERLCKNEKNENTCIKKVLNEYFMSRLKDAWKYVVGVAQGTEGGNEGITPTLMSSFEKIEREQRKKLCLVLKDEAVEITEECGCENTEYDAIKKIDEVLEKIEKDPPLVPKVTVVDVKEAFKEFESKFDEFIKKHDNIVEMFKKLKDEVKKELKKHSTDKLEMMPYDRDENVFKENMKKKLFFHWLLTNKYIKEVQKDKRISISNRAREKWTYERMKEAYSKGITNVKLCACGRPAIIHNNTDEFIPPLRPREALCPYCLVMRYAQYRQETYKKFVGEYDAKKVIAPRLHVMTLAGLPELARYVVENDKVKMFIVERDRIYEKEVSDKEQLFRGLTVALRNNALPQKVKEEGMKSLDLERLLEKLKTAGGAAVYVDDGTGNGYVLTFERNELTFIERQMNKYLVMIKADADGMGDLKSGRLGMKPNDYIKKLLRKIIGNTGGTGEEPKDEVIGKLIGKLSELVSTVIERFYEEFYPSEAVMEFCITKDYKFETNASIIPPTSNLPSTLVTPSYAYQLSYTLMIEALRDKDIVLDNYGVVIYAGGDDLLALVPARALYDGKCMKPLGTKHVSADEAQFIRENYCSPALWAWWLTRLNHWGLTEPPYGFFKGDHYFAPALLAYGKKYGIAIRHYRDPLSVVFEEADDLERKAKTFKKRIGESTLEKDGVAVSYGRSGTVEGGAVPNTLLIQEKKELPSGVGRYVAELVKEVVDKDGCLSRNYVHDLDLQLSELCGYMTEWVKSPEKGEKVDKKRTDEFLRAIEAVWLLATQRNLANKDCKAIKIIKEMLEKTKEDKVIVKLEDRELDVERSRLVLVCELAKFLREWVRAAR